MLSFLIYYNVMDISIADIGPALLFNNVQWLFDLALIPHCS